MMYIFSVRRWIFLKDTVPVFFSDSFSGPVKYQATYYLGISSPSKACEVEGIQHLKRNENTF